MAVKGDTAMMGCPVCPAPIRQPKQSVKWYKLDRSNTDIQREILKVDQFVSDPFNWTYSVLATLYSNRASYRIL